MTQMTNIFFDKCPVEQKNEMTNSQKTKDHKK